MNFVDHELPLRFPRQPRLENSFTSPNVSVQGSKQALETMGDLFPVSLLTSEMLRHRSPSSQTAASSPPACFCERHSPAPHPPFTQLVPTNTDIHSGTRLLFFLENKPVFSSCLHSYLKKVSVRNWEA